MKFLADINIPQSVIKHLIEIGHSALSQFPLYQHSTIVIRLRNLNPENIRIHLDELLKNQKEEILTKSLTIVKDESALSYGFS